MHVRSMKNKLHNVGDFADKLSALLSPFKIAIPQYKDEWYDSH